MRKKWQGGPFFMSINIPAALPAVVLPKEPGELCLTEHALWGILPPMFRQKLNGSFVATFSGEVHGCFACSVVACIDVNVILNEKRHDVHLTILAGHMQGGIAPNIRISQVCTVLNEQIEQMHGTDLAGDVHSG